MSSQSDVPLDPGPPLRHSYDSLFGDDEAASPPSGRATPPAAAAAALAPLSYDDPAGDEQPYLPPAARDRSRPDAPADDEAEAAARPDAAERSAATGDDPDGDPGWDGDPALAARAARPVDTGRLYHSAGAEAAAGTGAIPAIQVAGGREPTAEPAIEPVATERPEPAPAAAAAQPRVRFEGIAAGKPAETPPAAAPAAATARSASGLTYLGVITVVAVPTLLVGLAQALISNRVGWLTGLVLVVTSVYAALTVRRPDFSAAVVVPPLAFLLTILVAGQLTLAEGGSLLVREGFVLVRGLAENAPWILGATALAAIIVIVRARRR